MGVFGYVCECSHTRDVGVDVETNSELLTS